jgi:glycyl-tRNA synthetase alpha chain
MTKTLKKSSKPVGLTFQQLIFELQKYWSDRGCILQQPYDVEVGAGTMHPETFLRVLGPDPYRVAYVQPSRRPTDGRYGENPNRLYKHTQGAWGIGWQVLLDGLEITQFTYFQQSGGMNLDPASVELTYGLERIASFLQEASSVFDLRWSDDVSYGHVRLAEEQQFSAYSFEAADVDSYRRMFEMYEKEALGLLDRFADLGPEEQSRFPVLAAYDLCLKCSHLFNVLDSRRAISTTERAAMIGRVRTIACRVAEAYLAQRGQLPATAANGERR